MTSPDMPLEVAERVFAELVEDQRDRALWSLREGITVSIREPVAGAILASLARVANRSTWLTIRKLEAWRLRHCS